MTVFDTGTLVCRWSSNPGASPFIESHGKLRNLLCFASKWIHLLISINIYIYIIYYICIYTITYSIIIQDHACMILIGKARDKKARVILRRKRHASYELDLRFFQIFKPSNLRGDHLRSVAQFPGTRFPMVPHGSIRRGARKASVTIPNPQDHLCEHVAWSESRTRLPRMKVQVPKSMTSSGPVTWNQI